MSEFILTTSYRFVRRGDRLVLQERREKWKVVEDGGLACWGVDVDWEDTETSYLCEKAE